MSRINWPVLMTMGLGDLGLHPDQFWALTPAELVLMGGIDPHGANLGSKAFAALQAAYPDGQKSGELYD